MAHVFARKSIEFMDLHWAISKGETKELPASKAAQTQILAHSGIVLVPTKAVAKKVVPPKAGVN